MSLRFRHSCGRERNRGIGGLVLAGFCIVSILNFGLWNEEGYRISSLRRILRVRAASWVDGAAIVEGFSSRYFSSAISSCFSGSVAILNSQLI